MVAVGILMFYLWMSYSSQLIWDVRVEGNTKTDKGEITEMLADLGCGIGDRYTKINFNKLHADYAAMQHDIAWLSVFMRTAVWQRCRCVNCTETSAKSMKTVHTRT